MCRVWEDHRLAGGMSDHGRVNWPPSPAPGPLKHFQVARLGTPSAELCISSPSRSTKQTKLSSSPEACWPGLQGRPLWEGAPGRFSEPV